MPDPERHHSSILITVRDRHYLFDCGHGATRQLVRAGIDPVGVDVVFLSHLHYDHIADVAKIANRTGATVVSNYEITTWLAKEHGVKEAIGGNLGGTVGLPFGRVKLTLAFHSSSLPDGSNGGNPSGFLITLASGEKLYFACDTALFGDMSLIGAGGLDLAVLPIGDLFTMGPDDALTAARSGRRISAGADEALNLVHLSDPSPEGMVWLRADARVGTADASVTGLVPEGVAPAAKVGMP